jgi:hypothetical protein
VAISMEKIVQKLIEKQTIKIQ